MVTDVVLVGTGERARAWLTPLSRSGRLRLAATVARGEEHLGGDLPHYRTVSEALHAHPRASFAVTLPPRAALAAALELAAHDRPAIVEAPLHGSLAHADLGRSASSVRVAHGWTTLPGVRFLQSLIGQHETGELYLEVSGVPEASDGDLDEVIVHSLALVHALVPKLEVRSAHHSRDPDFQLGVADRRKNWRGQLRLRTRSQRVALHLEVGKHIVDWHWEDDRESLRIDGSERVAGRVTPPATVRALAQLLPDGNRGDSLVDAAATMRLMGEVDSILPNPLPPGRRRFAQSASVARRRPDDLLARLGFAGSLPAPTSLVERATIDMPAEPMELWAFRAGIKPVVFLTVRPDEVDATLACFGDAHCERRERLVRVEAQDRWDDRRDQGEPFVELYIAHRGDEDMAEFAARLQETNPSDLVRDLGTAVGYPVCCIEAFARQDDRANNSRNRYFSQARTRTSEGAGVTPWAWPLNNLQVMLVPFYPCTYLCPEAREFARQVLNEMESAHRGSVARLEGALRRPVLYFDHDLQLVFDGESDGTSVHYRKVLLAPAASDLIQSLAAAIAAGDRLVLDDRELRVERDGEGVLQLLRTDPALGFLAPF